MESTVIFDNNFLTSCVNETDSNNVSKKFTHLLKEIEKKKITILIPTPVLSEFLCHVKDKQAMLDIIQHTKYFDIAPFDIKASVECANLVNNRVVGKSEINGGWQKIKFDNQIIAIAKSRNIKKIYSSDKDFCKIAKLNGIEVITEDDLESPQMDLFGDTIEE